MPLNIKDHETHELARRLAERTGESMTKAVRRAVEERLRRVEESGNTTLLIAKLNGIAAECASSPEYDPRNADEIIGYDERGLPS